MKISIITINYNNAVGLEYTINSVVKQTSQEKEFIIVDGASSDGSVEIIKKYSNHITKWLSEPDTGIYNAMNKGIRLATGDYCIMMNSGDGFYSPRVLDNVRDHLLTSKDIYNGNAIYVRDGRIIWYRKCQTDSSAVFFFKSSLCHQATFIKTSLLKEIMYDESYMMVSDWKFYIEALFLKHASYEAIDEDICCFEWGGITAQKPDLGKREREDVLNKLFSSEEKVNYQLLSSKKNTIKFILEGIKHRFWLYYARLFMKQLHKND